MWDLSLTLKLLTLFSAFVGLANSNESSITFFDLKLDCLFYNSKIAKCRLIKISRKDQSCEFDFESIFNVTTGLEKNDLCVVYEQNKDCPESHDKILDSKFGFRIEASSDVKCHQVHDFSKLKTDHRLIQEHNKRCSHNFYQDCILKINNVKNNFENKSPHQNPQNVGPGSENDAGILSRNSVLFVAVSFILLMVISLAWLVFYYVQRFRYIHSKERVSRCLADLAKKAVARIPVKTLKPGDKEIGPEIDQCAICIEAYRALDNVRILPCRHFFHKQCIDPWLLEQRSCPMCKLDILHAYGLRPELGGCGNNNNGHSSNNNNSALNPTNPNNVHHPQSQLQQHGHYNHQSTSPAHLNQTIQFLGNIQGQHHRQHRLHHHHHQTTSANSHHSNGQIHLPSSIVPNAIVASATSGQGQSGGSPHSSSLPSLNAILDYHETLFPQAIPTVHQGTISQNQSTNQSHSSTTNMNGSKKNRIFFHKNPFDNSLIMSQSQHYYSHQPAGISGVNGPQTTTGPIVVVTSQGPSGNHLIQSINSEAFTDVNEFSERISINHNRPVTFRERFSQNWRSLFSRRGANNGNNNNQISDRNMCLNSGYNQGQFEDLSQSNERRRNRRERRKNRKNHHNLLNNNPVMEDQPASPFQYSIVAMQQNPTSQTPNQQMNQITMMNNASSHIFNQDLSQISAFTTDSNGNRIICQNYPFLKHQQSSPQLDLMTSTSKQSYQIITTQNPVSFQQQHFENDPTLIEPATPSATTSEKPELIVVIVENDKSSLPQSTCGVEEEGTEHSPSLFVEEISGRLSSCEKTSLDEQQQQSDEIVEHK